MSSYHLDHLAHLETEAIHIMREVASEFERPVLLFSGGKDSICLLRLAEKAFRPGKFPFPLLHIDTGHNYDEVTTFRDKRAAELGERLIVRNVEDSMQRGTVVLKHEGESRNKHQSVTLLEAIEEFGFDACIGGARRDEEKSRAKERIFSLREPGHRWDPRKQRPEFWRTANTMLAEGQTMRAFPISNWTEFDIWRYIRRENIPIVDLYFGRPRPVVQREGTWIMVDDDRLPLREGEEPQMRSVRFRTLGCYPLSGAVESTATDLDTLIAEMLESNVSERAGRLIDGEGSGSMEAKKAEGYF